MYSINYVEYNRKRNENIQMVFKFIKISLILLLGYSVLCSADEKVAFNLNGTTINHVRTELKGYSTLDVLLTRTKERESMPIAVEIVLIVIEGAPSLVIEKLQSPQNVIVGAEIKAPEVSKRSSIAVTLNTEEDGKDKQLIIKEILVENVVGPNKQTRVFMVTVLNAE